VGEKRSSKEPGIDWVERLRDLRRLMGWSQRRLAKELRVTPGAVSQWESRQRAIPGPVQRLAEIYEQNLGMLDPPTDPGLKKINSSWVARTARASTTTARIVGRLAGSSLQSLITANARATEIEAATQVAIAGDLVQAVGEMKGVALKLGQMASYMDLGLPKHLREALSPLRDSSRPLSDAAIREAFLEFTGKTPEMVFDRWNARPIAAASIGQVHRAKSKDGTDVAVKVQYPGIRAAIEADLDTVAAMDLLARLGFRGRGRADLVEELRERLLEECDYSREADNQCEFRRIYADTPHVVIPRVYRELSTDRVLTTAYVEGKRFAAFVAEADQKSRDRAGEIIFRVATRCIFEHRIFNGDPNPGNFLFLEDGSVAFLDFGCVKRFSRDLIRDWAQYLRAAIDDRRVDADRLLVKLGFVEDRDAYDFAYHHEMMRAVLEPFRSDKPFRFNQHFVERHWTLLVAENPNKARLSLPRDFLFLNRLQSGLHSVLAQLNAEAPWRAIFEENVASLGNASPLGG